MRCDASQQRDWCIRLRVARSVGAPWQVRHCSTITMPERYYERKILHEQPPLPVPLKPLLRLPDQHGMWPASCITRTLAHTRTAPVGSRRGFGSVLALARHSGEAVLGRGSECVAGVGGWVNGFRG